MQELKHFLEYLARRTKFINYTHFDLAIVRKEEEMGGWWQRSVANATVGSQEAKPSWKLRAARLASSHPPHMMAGHAQTGWCLPPELYQPQGGQVRTSTKGKL